MEIISRFSESLKDLIHEFQLTVEDLAKAIDNSKNRIYEWLSGRATSMPTHDNLIKLADYFKCSLEFLLGIEQENYLPSPKKCPPFSIWFRTAVETKGYSLYSLGKKINMSTGNFYNWINNVNEPSLDSLLRIAAALDCTLDYLVGRE